jgi:hypothetical protein
MALEHHFVVVVKNGVIGIDYDSTDYKFDEGSIWNEKFEEWNTIYEHPRSYEIAHELLQNAIMTTWKDNA